MTAVLPVVLLVIFENATAESTLRLSSGLQTPFIMVLLPPDSAAQIGAKLLSLAI
jgi:hypothetical protein